MWREAAKGFGLWAAFVLFFLFLIYGLPWLLSALARQLLHALTA